MPKNRIDRMRDFLDESQSVSEKLEKIGMVCVDDNYIFDDEKDLISKTLQDIFIPTKEVNGEQVFDKEKSLKNLDELHRLQTELVARRGRERVMWLSYFDKKDGVNISVNGRNENINRAIEMSNQSGNFLLLNALSTAMIGLFNGNMPPMDGDSTNTEEFLRNEVFRQTMPKDFVNEEQQAFFNIGSMDPKKLTEVTPEQKKSDEKLLSEYNNYVKSFFSNGNNVPWYNDDEVKQLVEKQSVKSITYDENYITPLMSEISLYKDPENIIDVYNNNLSTFMEPSKYDLFRRIAVFKQLSEGKKINEITVKAEDLKNAEIICNNCRDGEPSEEFSDILSASIKSLKASLLDVSRETDKDKINEFLKVEKDLSELHKSFNMSAKDWGRIRSYIVVDENELKLNAVVTNYTVDKMVQNEYGLPSAEAKMTQDDMDILLHGGFRDTIFKRPTSVGYTAYAYKLLNTPTEKRPNGYEPELGKGCGREYLDFMAKYPVFEEIGKPIEDKEKLKENVKKHAEFYKQWGEMLAKEPLEDFTNPDKLRDPKVIERALYLNQMAIEFSQNSENLRTNAETKAMFMEAFGGAEYYERLTGVVGLHQTIGLSVMTYVNPAKDISARAGALSFLDMCGKKGGSIEGKTVLDIDPEIYSFNNCLMYTSMAMAPFIDINSTEVTGYLNSGVMPDEAKKDIEGLFNSMADENVPKLKKEQMKLKKDLEGKKWTLLDEMLSKPSEKIAPNEKRNLFEKIDINTKFSTELKEKLAELKNERDAISAVTDNFFKTHPNAKITGFLDGIEIAEDTIVKGFDERNLSDFMLILFEPDWTLDQKKEFTNDFMERFYSSKEERYKLLGKVYDKMDDFSLAHYDLSCASGNGKDKGERGADGLTASERDLISYCKINRNEQAFRTTRYGFADFFQARYNTIRSEVEYRAKEQELKAPNDAMSLLLRGNGIEYSDFSKRAEIEFEPGDEMSYCGIGNMLGVSDMQNKLISGTIEPEDSNLVVNWNLEKPTGQLALNVIRRRINETLYDTSLGVDIGKTYAFTEWDNIYIDGIRADEFVEPFLEKGQKKENLLNSMITSGEHRIETVSFGINTEGNITPIISTINTYNNELYKEDPGRERRVERIRDDMNSRLGPNKKFYDVLDASNFSMNKEQFNEESKKYKNKALPPKAQTYEEKITTLKGELKAIDTWYHINSKEYKAMLEAMENPADSKKLIEAANAYINRYVKEDNTFQRRTDLGNARISKIMEIKCAVKDNEKEKETKVLEGIANRKAERQKFNKDAANIKDLQKESGIKERDIAKTKKLEKTLEKTLNETLNLN